MPLHGEEADNLRNALTPDGLRVVGGGSNGAPISVTQTVATIGHGSRTVTTAGTDLQLSATSIPCVWVTIEAYRSNTGYIAIGGTGVDAAASTGSGITLAAGDAATIPASNLNAVYIDATVSGEGVRYTHGV